MEKVKNVSVTGYEVGLWDYISNCELSFGNIKKMSGKETVLKSLKSLKGYFQPYFYTLIYLYFYFEHTVLSIIQTPKLKCFSNSFRSSFTSQASTSYTLVLKQYNNSN